MDEIKRFDPFSSRLCRNVRNSLSEGFKDALVQKDLAPVHRIAELFLQESLPSCVKDYINDRVKAYERVLSLTPSSSSDPLVLALTIWDNGLFFETHEYLEQYWMHADRDEKKLLQALIRAAGAYVHLSAGNLTAARKIADKALLGLKAQKERLADVMDPDLLIDKLAQLDPVAPVLSRSSS